MEKHKTILRLKKDASCEVRVVLCEYKGKKRCDIRAYYSTDNGNNWLPTQKGISIPLEMIEQFVKALQ